MNSSSTHSRGQRGTHSSRHGKNARSAKLDAIFPVTPGVRDIAGLKMIARNLIVVEHQLREDAKSGVQDMRSNILEMKSKNLGLEGCGIMTALQVTPHPDLPGKFKLIFGERRYWGSDGILDELPCVVCASNAQADLVQQGIENILRKNFTPIEEVNFVRRLRDELGFTQKAIGDLTGQHKNWVENRWNLSRSGKNKNEVAADIRALFSRVNNPGATLTNALLIDSVKENPTLRKRLLREADKGAPERALQAILEAHKTQSAPDESKLAPRGTSLAQTGSRVARIADQASLPMPASRGTTPTPGTYFGQAAAGGGVAITPQTAGEVAQATDALRDLIQPAGTSLAEAVGILKNSTKKPPAAALRAALATIESQVKQLKKFLP